jgi:vitamin B12 transporter
MKIRYCTILLSTLTAVPASTLYASPVLEELVITSSRLPTQWSQIATAITILDSDQIAAYGTVSLVDVLKYQPSVSVTRTGGAGKASTVRIRGEEGYRTLVLLDGIPLTDTSGTQHSARLEHLLTQGITSLEILRGPQGLLYGADAGGIISLSSKPTEDGVNTQIQFESGRYQSRSQAITSAYRSANGFISATVNEISTDGFNASTADTELRDDDGYENLTTQLSGQYSISDSLSLSGSYRRVSADNEYDGCYNANFSLTHRCDNSFDMQSGRVALSWGSEVSDSVISLTQTEIDKAFLSEGVFSFGASGKIDQLSYVGRKALVSGVDLIFGAELERSRLNDGQFQAKRGQNSVFTELQWAPSDDSLVSFAARHDDNDDFGRHVSTRASYVRIHNSTVGIFKYKASLGTGFRAPSLYEIAYNTGPFAFGSAAEQALEEELSRGVDVGVEYIGPDGTHVQVTLFKQSIRNAIEFDLEGYSGYLQTQGTGRVQGLEMLLDWPVTDSVALRASATFMDSEDPEGDTRIYRPDQQGALTLEFTPPHSALSLSSALLYRGDSRGINQQLIEGYTSLDLRANWQLTAKVASFVRVENALDADNREIPGFYGVNSALYAGLTIHF